MIDSRQWSSIFSFLICIPKNSRAVLCTFADRNDTYISVCSLKILVFWYQNAIAFMNTFCESQILSLNLMWFLAKVFCYFFVSSVSHRFLQCFVGFILSPLSEKLKKIWQKRSQEISVYFGLDFAKLWGNFVIWPSVIETANVQKWGFIAYSRNLSTKRFYEVLPTHYTYSFSVLKRLPRKGYVSRGVFIQKKLTYCSHKIKASSTHCLIQARKRERNQLEF